MRKRPVLSLSLAQTHLLTIVVGRPVGLLRVRGGRALHVGGGAGALCGLREGEKVETTGGSELVRMRAKTHHLAHLAAASIPAATAGAGGAAGWAGILDWEREKGKRERA